MKILLTGGLGYIGSHITVFLSMAGHEVVMLDNLSNCKFDMVDRIQLITGIAPTFIQGDIRDQSLLESVFKEFEIEAVIHLAGLKAVGESVREPLRYYENNVSGTISMLRAMESCNIRILVFSSSATVYGAPKYLPIDERHPTNPETPYGRSKLQIEEILRDLALADERWRVIALRYFNPVGAHESGLIGENPVGIPNNLMPIISQVALGQISELKIFGDDYDTHDGTGVRDYIHIMDLAEGHAYALDYLKDHNGFFVTNLGTGSGYSVNDLVETFASVSHRAIPFSIVDRRAGDVAVCYSNPIKAFEEMGWKSKKTLGEMCLDSWRWSSTSL